MPTNFHQYLQFLKNFTKKFQRIQKIVKVPRKFKITKNLMKMKEFSRKFKLFVKKFKNISKNFHEKPKISRKFQK